MVRAALLAAMLVVCGAGCGAAHHESAATTNSAPALRGLIPSPLPTKPRFTLTDTSGHPYDLAARTRGKLIYLYFGYTHCPDVCPLTMGDLSAALRLQPAAVRRGVAVVFVTVDPHRDTTRVLRRWLARYGPEFVGLTGTMRQILAAAHAAGIPLVPPTVAPDKNYAVDHSSLLLAYSPDDRAHVVYSQGFGARDFAHDMPLLLKF